jgi:hypothetical protein
MAGEGAATASKSSRAKSGSSFSDKQIYRSVKDSRPVTVTLPDGDTLTGWICGADLYHWGVADAAGDVHLVHKSVPSVKVSSSDLTSIPELVEKIVAPFRASVLRDHFSQQPSA